MIPQACAAAAHDSTCYKFEPFAFFEHACVRHKKITAVVCWLSKRIGGSRCTCVTGSLLQSAMFVNITGSVYRHEACCHSCATCRMNESCSITMGMVCHARLSMARSGSSTRATHNISQCPSTICKHGWALLASLSLTAQLLGSLSTPSRLLQSKRRRLASCLLQPFCLSSYSSYSSIHLFVICLCVHPSVFTFTQSLVHPQFHSFATTNASQQSGMCTGQLAVSLLCAFAECVSHHALDGIHKSA